MAKKKPKKITQYVEPKQYHRTLKCALGSIVTNANNALEKIQGIVLQMNSARFHTLQFYKLYCIHQNNICMPIPVMNKSYLMMIMRVLSENKQHGKSQVDPEIFNELKNFYETHCKPLISRKMESITGLALVQEYMITDIITDFENNIKMYHYNHLKKYILSITNFYEIKELKENPLKTELLKFASKVIGNLMYDFYSVNEPFKSEEFYHSFIAQEKVKVFPQRDYQEQSIYYDIKCSPQDYLPGMIYMAKVCEDNGHTFLNVFPLKRSIVPGHVRIDTGTLVDHFIQDSKERKLYKGHVKELKQEIWSMFFKTDKSVFKSKDFCFSGSIQTDGFSASVLLVKNEYYNRRTPRLPKPISENYIAEANLEILQDLKIVAIDPNKDDLIHCSTGTRDSFQSFRYTQNQRSKETRKRKHRDILQKEKLREPLVVAMEVRMSNENSKTLDFNKFKNYISVKSRVNLEIKYFYERMLWRKLKLSTYVRTQQSESRMINNFKKKFGPPETAFVAIGDWSQASQMRFKEPSKGKSFRKLFRKAGYKVYLVNEFRTSMMCSHCKNENGICETFKKKKSPRPWRKRVEINCHGLVKCKTCNTLFNRDVNSTLNIREIVLAALQGVKRPDYLSRTNSEPVIAGGIKCSCDPISNHEADV